jgi:L-asparaginase
MAQRSRKRLCRVAMAAGKFSAPKARIALQLALNAEKQAKSNGKSLTWQDFFARMAVLPEIG